MIKHIVLWKLHEQAQGASKQENAQEAKRLLESLAGKIPGLIHIEVGIDELGGNDSVDIALYSELESLEALNEYQNHPEHVKLKPFMQAIRCERRVIDYHI